MIPAFGYVRVSRAKREQISPAVQREAILEEAEKRGWEIVRFFEDIDRSATKLRPLELAGFSEMVTLAKAGGAGAVLFYRVDRAVREHSGEFDIVQTDLRRAGVSIGFTNRQYDDTPEGAFALDLDIALSRLEVRRLGERLQRMHKTLASQGKYGGNFAPFGWKRVRDPDGQQRIVLDPEESVWRREIHALYWKGWSLQRIADHLNRHDVKTRRGTSWCLQSVRKCLMAEVQTGVRTLTGRVSTGRIEPLLTEEEYARTLAVQSARQRWPERKTDRRALRGSLVRCGTCGCAMYLVQGRAKQVYRCQGRIKRVCERGTTIKESILVEAVEREVLRRLKRLRPPQTPQKPTGDIGTLIDAEKAATEALGRLVALYAAGEISEEEWRTGRAAANERLTKVRGKLEKARRDLERPSLTEEDYALFRGITPERWADLNNDQKHALYRFLIDRVEVNPKGIEPRIHLYWK